MTAQNILDIDTVSLDTENTAVVIIDQTLLPNEVRLLSLTNAKDMREAIYLLKVRGAPAIGVTAALGMYVLSARSSETDPDAFAKEFEKNKTYLNAARPTAVNLSWALERMDSTFHCVMQKMQTSSAGISESGHSAIGNVDASGWKNAVLEALKKEALTIYSEDIEVCRRIGEYGLSLIHDGDGILTHCNAGKLAAVRYGTATAPMYLAKEQGIRISVYCDETRPLLQGARLTAYELQESGIDTTLLCDNMSASLMRQGKIQAIFVGCDRVAANGDTANKIGTSVVAAVAKKYGVPFYVCAPTSTIDRNTPDGDSIVIEQRKPEEVTEMWYEKRMAPQNVKVCNPAFDVTDNEDIAAIVTEYGIAYPPYTDSLREIFQKKEMKA